MNHSKIPGFSLSRRAVLRGAATLLCGAPLLRLLENSALAEPTAGLSRFIGVYMPHGVAKELWRPGQNFNLTYPDCSLAPFDDSTTFGRSFKQNLLVIEGLDLAAGIDGGTTGHDAPRVILTGSPGFGKNASLDQFLALECGLGSQTPETSLILGVGFAQPSPGFTISYARGGTPLPKIIDPSVTFKQAFVRFIVGATPEAQAREDARRRRGQSVLDYLVADANRLSSRLAGQERIKLDQHLTSLRELEKRLAQVELSCTLPKTPDMSGIPKVTSGGGGEHYFHQIIELQIDLLAQALSCGITRFATLFLPDLSHTNHDPELPPDVHDQVAHRYNARQERADGSVTFAGKPDTWRPLARQNHYLYSHVARLAQRLAENHMLDGTLIYATSDMGDPARHSSRQVPTVLVGGTGSFRMGRYLNFAKDAGNAIIGLPNNRLLVSICQAFGIAVDSFGESPLRETNVGSLPDLV